MSTDWLRASCLDYDPEMWTTPHHKPGPDGDALVATARLAMAICARCPILNDCAKLGPLRSVIVAGIPYDDNCRPAPKCGGCGLRIVGRNGVLAKYCSKECTDRAARRAAYRRVLAA